jgi:hypothetical protein
MCYLKTTVYLVHMARNLQKQWLSAISGEEDRSKLHPETEPATIQFYYKVRV